MKTLSAPLTTEIAATETGWCEVYDIYLKTAIVFSGVVGTTDTLRLTTLPAGLSYFTPKQDPEPAGTQGNAQDYIFWPLKRQTVKADNKSGNDKMTVAASNVTSEFASMLAAVDWRDTPFVIRKVPTSIASPTADDCDILFIGLVDSVHVTLEQLTFTLSNGLGTLAITLPRENMHQACRFNFADDLCTQIPWSAKNYVPSMACDAGSDLVTILSASQTQDSLGTTARYAVAVTADSTTDRITLNAHGLGINDMVKFQADVMPGGLTADTWYYIQTVPTANTFTLGVAPFRSVLSIIDITSNGTNVTMDTYGRDLVSFATAITGSSTRASWSGQAVGVDAAHDEFNVGSHGMVLNEPVQFHAAIYPAPLAALTTYYVIPVSADFFKVAATPNGPPIDITTNGNTVTFTELNGHGPINVNIGADNGYWYLNGTGDWGTLSQGYWEIPAGQEGLFNAALKPWIQFQFPANRKPGIWRISTPADIPVEQCARMIAIFASPDGATWEFITFFEIPPTPGIFHEIQIPDITTARTYWRICFRSTHGGAWSLSPVDRIACYDTCRNYWQGGTLTWLTNGFGSFRILRSYPGAIVLAGQMAVAPSAGDTFSLQRGCNRSWNACCEKKNWENFGGFLDLPLQTIIRS